MEILTMGGLLFLASHGPIAFFLMRFVEKLDDPAYEEKVFSKSLWNKK